MAYRILYIGLLLALSSSVICCNAVEQQHLRGRGNQKKERSLNGIFSTAYRIVSPHQSYHKRIQTIPAANNNNDLKSTYIQQCQSYLLDDPSITNDGIISQVDFANMLLNQCQQLDMCPYKKLKFEQLDINLQLKFINGICYHQDRVDKFRCIKNLNGMWLEGKLFGFELDGDEDVETLVYDVCTDTYADAVKMGLARSNAPTLSPSTALPTKQPSLMPSNGPSSQSPTNSPSRTTVSSIPKDRHQDSSILFVDDCASYLLSPNALEDGIISQTEYTQFLARHCIQQDLCDDGTVVEFEQLDINLQLEFVLGVCNHEDQEGKVQCVTNLEVMWRDNHQFGFDVNDIDMHLLSNDVMGMCANTYNHVLDMGLTVSQAPTKLITTSPSQSPVPSQSQPPSASERPSSVTNEVESGAPNDEKSIAKGTVLGLSFGLALTVAAAYLVFINHHSDSGPSSDKDISSQKDDGAHFNAQFKPWSEAEVPSLSLSYLRLNNCSISSSNSSFRDYRFTTVFGPKGESIPQFDPNQAAAVVIGSVTIGDSSSYSSGPFTSGSRSYSTSTRRSFFSFGRRLRKFKSASSTRDDMSSLSSNRSTSFSREYRALGRHRKGSISRSRSIQSSHSRNTVPLTHRRRQKIDHLMQSNNQVSLGDWNAISYMTAECRNSHHNQAATDVGAALQQSKFFFDTLLCPETSQLSDTNTLKSSQSMPNIYRVCSSDAGASVLSESFFVDGSSFIQPPSVTDSDSTSHPSDEQFVPWRKEGFNSSLQLSDSCSVVSSSVESHVPESTTKKVLGLVITPTKGAKALFSKCRKNVKARGFRSFKHRQYHHMNRDLHVVAALQEDGEVGSMISYSSNTNLLPPPTVAPNLVAGSFAAAIVVSNKRPHYMLESPSPPSQTESVAEDVEEDTPSIDDKIEMDVQPETVTPVQSIQSSRKVTVVRNISSLDICSSDDSENKTQSSESTFEAYSRSDFDSTTVSSSSKHSRCDTSSASNSTDSSQTGSKKECNIDAAATTATLDVSKKYENIEEGGCIADISCLSNCTGTLSALPNLSTSEDTIDNSSSAIIHLIGISQILSETGSFESSKCHLNETNVISDSSGSDISFPSDEEGSRSVKKSTTGEFHIGTVIKNPEPVDDVSSAFSSPLHVESESISFDSLVLAPSVDTDIETTSMATTVLVNNQAKM